MEGGVGEESRNCVGDAAGDSAENRTRHRANDGANATCAANGGENGARNRAAAGAGSSCTADSAETRAADCARDGSGYNVAADTANRCVKKHSEDSAIYRIPNCPDNPFRRAPQLFPTHWVQTRRRGFRVACA
ncbi:hypothetical protein [Paraburkholderia sp. DGU8]|uniref:hypothetical protein n=1 Tax=Paraburkholderia sp. DGU8 TaxID=3161997 RepID=UPI003467A13D